MNNLKKFSTEAEYSAATLVYPAVSWVTTTDTVHFDKTAPVVNDKVKMAFTTDACGLGKTYTVLSDEQYAYNLDGITVNGEPFEPTGSDYWLTLASNTDYLIEYQLKNDVTDVNNWFALYPIEGCQCVRIKYDLLFPSQVSEIDALADNINNLIIQSETPPTMTFDGSDLGSLSYVYVPDSAVNTYKTASGWDYFGTLDKILPISEYQGQIPL